MERGRGRFNNNPRFLKIFAWFYLPQAGNGCRPTKICELVHKDISLGILRFGLGVSEPKSRLVHHFWFRHRRVACTSFRFLPLRRCGFEPDQPQINFCLCMFVNHAHFPFRCSCLLHYCSHSHYLPLRWKEVTHQKDEQRSHEIVSSPYFAVHAEDLPTLHGHCSLIPKDQRLR